MTTHLKWSKWILWPKTAATFMQKCWTVYLSVCLNLWATNKALNTGDTPCWILRIGLVRFCQHSPTTSPVNWSTPLSTTLIMFWFWIRFQIKYHVAINQTKGEVIVDMVIISYKPMTNTDWCDFYPDVSTVFPQVIHQFQTSFQLFMLFVVQFNLF